MGAILGVRAVGVGVVEAPSKTLSSVPVSSSPGFSCGKSTAKQFSCTTSEATRNMRTEHGPHFIIRQLCKCNQGRAQFTNQKEPE